MDSINIDAVSNRASIEISRLAESLSYEFDPRSITQHMKNGERVFVTLLKSPSSQLELFFVYAENSMGEYRTEITDQCPKITIESQNQ